MLCEKRLAIQLVAQLPEQPMAARRVLDLTRQLFDEFLVDQPTPGTIIPFKPKPQAPVAKMPHWLRRRWAVLVGSVALGTLIATAATDYGYTDNRIENLSLTLDKAVLLPGEPLRGTIKAKREVNCPGEIHRIVFQDNDEVVDMEILAEPRPTGGGGYTRSFIVPLPPLSAGHYAYETWAEFTCPDRRVIRTRSPRLPFLVLAADGL